MSKVFLVTGVSRGIGSSIVEKLCSIDTTKIVVGIARSKDKLEELKAQYSGKFDYICGDVSDEETITEAVNFIESKYKRLDGIVANAGVLDPVEDVNNIHISKWKQLFDINFFSVVSLVSHALPLLKQSNGNIVLVSSGASTKSYVCIPLNFILKRRKAG
ncbi:hypothetical protein KDRO_F06960 [Kluyveromyces lactis]|nr:hypothetical protein KDRO_F06960 [Kluyveromyces lactis]